MRLGTKLILSSAVLLALPWLGYRYLGALEDFLHQGQERAQTLAARALATLVQERAALLATDDEADGNSALYAYPLTPPPTIDGYTRDWAALTGFSRDFDGFTLTLARHARHLYALVEVEDERLVYRHPGHRRLDHADQLRLTLLDAAGSPLRLALTTEGPGAITAQRMDRRWRFPLESTPRYEVSGEWRERPGGYRVELRLPLSLFGDQRPGGRPRLQLAVADVDEERTRVVSGRGVTTLMPVVSRIEALERILSSFEHDEGRVWVVDRQRRVRAAAGPASGGGGLTERLPASLLGGALDGRAQVRRQPGPYGSTTLVASTPIHHQGRVVGAVVLEQPGGATRALHLRTLGEITLATLAVLLLTIAGLALFGGRLAWRIRRLGRESAAATDERGRLLSDQLSAERGVKDELGDLSSTISTLLTRLGRYTGFLEQMPRTLRHEINNPLNTISTSLQNLADAHPELADERYLASAERGVERIGRIVRDLTEAASLEEGLRLEQRHPFDLAALVHAYLESAAAQHPSRRFRHEGPRKEVTLLGSDLRLEQLLDKLVGNAVDFTPEGGEIVVSLEPGEAETALRVSNDGPPLPAAIGGRLFDSMVSLRSDRGGDNPHLGIGLFVARAIAEHHGGRLEAANRSDGGGAVFTVHFPLEATSLPSGSGP